MNLKKLSLEELEELFYEVKEEIQKRKEKKFFFFSTPKCYAPKHGPAYVARLYFDGEYIQREFLPSNGKEWCKKQKLYKETWEIELMELDVIEVRLESGSLDKREWYQIINGELEKLSDMSEAKNKLKI
ncbi:MAG: hypothetical protein DSY40_03995 [Nautilia sp.]|nr:MAG: hypothetical protein DSY40_03995 [Nautilia sp.]